MYYITVQEKHWCKAPKGVQATNAASDDKLVDIIKVTYIRTEYKIVTKGIIVILHGCFHAKWNTNSCY
jgi:hypothetical protein